MCMPFDFIDGLKDKKWTRIDQKWLARLMRHLKKAQSSNIKQIRIIRYIGRLDIYDNSREYEIEDDCYMYEVILENDLTHYVISGQINDIIGDEEWLQGEGNCLCNIASHLESYLFLWEQKRRNPLILMLYASVKVIVLVWKIMENTEFILDVHGGQDDSILSAIQAKSRSKSGHQRNSRQILQNRATESHRACAEFVPKLLLRIPLYVDF
jgi:hypothetical protein